MKKAPPIKNNFTHNNNFDFLRFLAATFVWYGHCYSIVGTQDPLEKLTGFESFGKFGVVIFFIISGYFITQSYDRKQKILPFLQNRFLRIFPALAVLLLLTVFVLGASITTLPLKSYFTDIDTWKYLRSILIFPLKYELPGVFMENPLHAVNGSLWTLKQEVRLYVILGLLGFIGVLNSRFMFFLFLTLLLTSIYGAYSKTDHFLWGKYDDVSLAINLGVLFSGGSLLYLLRNHNILQFKLFILFLGLLFASIDLPQGFSMILWNFSLIYIVIYLGFAKLPLIHKFGAKGDFSYGMYLYAFPLQQLSLYILGFDCNFNHLLILSFSLTLLFAVFSWYLIEKPVMKWKK
jgi:peptidoglycan/LPS O-acetylase OafA/YrhL